MAASKKSPSRKGGGDQSIGIERTLAQSLPPTCPHCGGPVSTALVTPAPEAQARGVAAIPARATSCVLLPDGDIKCGWPYRVAAASRAVDDALEARRQGACSRTGWLDPGDELWAAVTDSWLIRLAEEHGPEVVALLDSANVAEIDQELHLRLWSRGPELTPVADAVLQDLVALLRGTPIATVQLVWDAEAGTTVLTSVEVQR